MSIFSCLSNLLSSGCWVSSSDDFAINPANGNPMVGGTGGLDIEGNIFGTDSSNDQIGLSAFDDSWTSCSCDNFSDW
jgi:hypothetical protein